MRPLPRQFLIGLIVSLCVVGALAATWFTTMRPGDSLASRLPADAVLLYAVGPGDDLATLSDVTPPPIEQDTEAIALVQGDNGVTGWLSLIRDISGHVRIHGSDPSLESLLKTSQRTLSQDDTFRTLQWQGRSGWVYVRIPDQSPALAASYGKLLALDRPMAILTASGATTIRLPTSPTQNIPVAPDRPLATLSSVSHAVALPPWSTMERTGPLLTPQAQTVAKTIAATLLSGVADGMSLQYDASQLLAGPSFFQSGINASGASVFALEGTGRSATETDRLLRLAHDAFAAARGSASVKTLTAAGFTMRTIGQADKSETTEALDGTWTVLTTRTDAGTLTSAHDGARFAITTDPDALTRTNDTPTGGWSHLTLTSGVRRAIAPLWPDIASKSGILRWKMASGPGYIEWTWTHGDR